MKGLEGWRSCPQYLVAVRNATTQAGVGAARVSQRLRVIELAHIREWPRQAECRPAPPGKPARFQSCHGPAAGEPPTRSFVARRHASAQQSLRVLVARGQPEVRPADLPDFPWPARRHRLGLFLAPHGDVTAAFRAERVARPVSMSAFQLHPGQTGHQVQLCGPHVAEVT